MTRFGRSSPHDEGAEADRSEGVGVPTIDECRRLDAGLRQDLELVDYEVRRVFNQILAGVDQSGRDGALFLKASATVLLSIAAGLLETSAERTHDPVDVESFKTVAEDAAEWAKDRKLRYFTSGEG